MAYRVLGKLKWTGKLEHCTIVILHRGAPGNLKAISGASVTEVRRTYFSYASADGAGKPHETTIPMHRVMEISVNGQVVWRRKPKAEQLGRRKSGTNRRERYLLNAGEI